MDGTVGDVPRARENVRQRIPWGATAADSWGGLGAAPRALPEQCDNGGLTLHGCTRLCQVDTTAAWECRHYLRAVGATFRLGHTLLDLAGERPVFASRCELSGYSWASWTARLDEHPNLKVWPHTGNLLSSRRRRLSGAARPSG